MTTKAKLHFKLSERKENSKWKFRKLLFSVCCFQWKLLLPKLNDEVWTTVPFVPVTKDTLLVLMKPLEELQQWFMMNILSFMCFPLGYHCRWAIMNYCHLRRQWQRFLFYDPFHSFYSAPADKKWFPFNELYMVSLSILSPTCKHLYCESLTSIQIAQQTNLLKVDREGE